MHFGHCIGTETDFNGDDDNGGGGGSEDDDVVVGVVFGGCYLNTWTFGRNSKNEQI